MDINSIINLYNTTVGGANGTNSLGGLSSLTGGIGTLGVNTDFETAFNNAVSNITDKVTLESIFEKASKTYGVSEDLLKAVARAESNFDIKAVSKAGAEGIMQLMPETQKSFGVTDPFDAEQNIMAGANLLSGLLKKYNGNKSLALAAYNAGSGAVDKYGGIPPYKETQNYVTKVLSFLDDNYDLSNISVDGTISRYSPAKNISKVYSSYEDYVKSTTKNLNISQLFSSMASNSVLGATTSSSDWVSSVNAILMQMLINNMTGGSGLTTNNIIGSLDSSADDNTGII